MTRRSVDLPQPLGPMSATMPPSGIVEVDAVEDRERRAGPAREGERQVAQPDRSGAGRRCRHATARPSGRRTGAVAG